MAKSAEQIKVNPLRPADFGLIEHTVRRFNAVVPSGLSKDELEDPGLWVNVAGKLEMGSEIRCLALDMSFVAYGICTYAQGTIVKLKVIEFHKLDAIDIDQMDAKTSDFEVKMRGQKKWCISKRSTGEIIKEGIPTKTECLKELEDYQRALAA